MVQERNDRLTARRVEEGLYVQKSSSTRKAASYLASYGVPFEVALRVLTTPHRRDMGDLMATPSKWDEIVRAAGVTYGLPVNAEHATHL